ncbi:MAG: DUF2310 family Zn-ribbon-containing protein [Planctomycetaceae bacterium]
MLLAKISFIPHMDHEEAELVAVAEAWLGTLLKNGQICGNHVTGWTDGIYIAYVRMSHRKAGEHRYLSEWGRHTLAAVIGQFGAEPVWEILDDEVAARRPSWKSARSLYLFTHFLHIDSPVFHGNRGTSLPLQLLPTSERLREEIFDWSESCRFHDRIFLESGALELPAYEQLANPASELMSRGRELAKAVETATKKPTYVYLLRHWGHLEFEDIRPCPKCGGGWRDPDSPMPSKEPFCRFHFRCESCRLVSHRAVAFEQNEHWKIGVPTGWTSADSSQRSGNP